MIALDFRGTCEAFGWTPFNKTRITMEQDSKKKVSVLFMLFGTLFCVCLITANVLETKQLSFGPINLTAGVIVFPVSYIINDVVCEVWGYRRTRMLIWMGFAMNFFFVVMGAIADWIPGAHYWHGDEGFHQIFGLAPRIALASFVAFICGSFMNAYVMSRMKLSSREQRKTDLKGRMWGAFSSRAILSTVFGEGIDSLIFFPLALGGVIPWEEMPSLMISQVTLKSLRSSIGIVQQDVYLFSGTIRDNVAYGKPGATREEIIAAAKLAGADGFIRELPDGYDTYVGERGARLSGGQKQRISIARVFLKNPPILILDEATSALDNESEHYVQESLAELAKGRTTLTIAHRLSTVRNADRIIVLTENGVEEEGTHDELIKKGGIYASMHNFTL